MLYNYLRNTGFVFLITLGLFSCKSSQNNPTAEINPIKSNLIDEAIKSNFNASDSIQIIPNEDGNWILYLTKKEANLHEPAYNTSFFVYDKIKNQILYKNTFSRASIQWHNNNQLLYIKKLGIINKQTGMNIKRYIIDIESNKTTELNTKTQNNK